MWVKKEITRNNKKVKNRPPLRENRGNKSGRSFLEERENQEQHQCPSIQKLHGIIKFLWNIILLPPVSKYLGNEHTNGTPLSLSADACRQDHILLISTHSSLNLSDLMFLFA